jgi:CelD/BcsL family acetyltransferase involved in cellulose biosynthesis
VHKRSSVATSIVRAEPFSSPEVRIIRDYAGFVALRQQWDELFNASSTRSAPLRFGWLAEWWRVYGPVYGVDGGGLSVVTVWNNRQLVGALPLYRRVEGRFIRHARLQFLSTGEAEFEETCPEFMDVLARPGQEEMVVTAVYGALSEPDAQRWDDLLLLDLSEDSPLLPAWRHGGHRGYSVDTASRGGSPTADLRGGFEAYLGRLSANSRQQARRTIRAAERAGAALELMSTPAEVDACFDDLVQLHQSRWQETGKAGCFSASRFTEFHRALAREFVPRSTAVLARLHIRDEPLAVIYGFLTGDKFDFYQSGVRLDGLHGLARPGIVAHLLLMARLAGRGVTCYDFLRGSADYKQRLSTSVRPLVRLRVVRPTGRSAVWEAAKLGRRVVHKVLDRGGRLVGRFRGAAARGAANHLCAVVHSTLAMCQIV